MSIKYYSLKVVECVRQLGLSLKFHNDTERLVYPKNLSKSDFKEKLKSLVKALEEFDQNTGENESFNLTYEKDIYKVNAEIEKSEYDLDEQLITENELKKDIKVEIPSVDRKYDLEEVFEDGGTDHNLGDSLDAIMDKLEFAATKVGWTPKMRILAAALKNAEMKRLSIDKEIDEDFLLEWKRVLEVSLDIIYADNNHKASLNHRQKNDLSNSIESTPKYNRN